MEQSRFGHRFGHRVGQLPPGCEHLPTWVGPIAVTACAECAEVDWFSRGGPIDAAEGMAALFGSFELVGPIDALGAPAPRVLVYTATSARKRSNLTAFPRRVWLKATPHLWMSHDDKVLLLAPTTPLAYDNLVRNL